MAVREIFDRTKAAIEQAKDKAELQLVAIAMAPIGWTELQRVWLAHAFVVRARQVGLLVETERDR